MNYIDAIRQYVPTCEQEASDQKIMLEYYRLFGDGILSRTCALGHVTASSMIFNRERTKVLMIYHNIYDSWAWTGGHADGEGDCLATAIKEAKEETGLKNVRVISEAAAALDILGVQPHVKRGQFVSAHVHLNLTYLLEADESETLHICEGENSNVGWIPMDQIEEMVSEAHMLQVYRKLIQRI